MDSRSSAWEKMVSSDGQFHALIPEVLRSKDKLETIQNGSKGKDKKVALRLAILRSGQARLVGQ